MTPPHHLIGANSHIRTATVTISQHASSNVISPTRLRLTCHPAKPRQRSAESRTTTNRPERDPWQTSQPPCRPDVNGIQTTSDYPERAELRRPQILPSPSLERNASSQPKFPAASTHTQLFPLGPAPVRTPMEAREQGCLGDGLIHSARPMPKTCLRETNQLRWQDEEASWSPTKGVR